jgi:ParB/Sulfiredoxin domain
MDIRELPLDELVLDEELYLRDRLDDFTVERYADAWERLPPVTVFEVDGRYLLADGFHRHAAAVMLNHRTIPAEIRVGTFEDALDFVSSVNLFHGLPLTRAERRRAVEVKLRIHPDWSDRRLAEGMAVGRELIAKVRRQLVEAGQVPGDVGRIGSDGKTYSAGREPAARTPKAKPTPLPEEPSERPGGPGWEEAAAAVPAAPRAEVGDKKVAITPAGTVSVSTINEMLEMMARQIMEVVNWTQAEGFTEAYRKASANSRGLFQSASIKLAARADQLRRS